MSQSVPPSTAATVPVHPVSIGSVAVTVIDVGSGTFPDYAVAAATALPSDLDRVLREHGISGDGPVTLGLNVALVQTGPHTVLLDTGAGAAWGGEPDHLERCLRASGVEPDQVDVVVLSHAHPDHVGGVLRDDESLVFPNARHVLPRIDYDFWVVDPPLGELAVDAEMLAFLRLVPERILPALGDRLELIDPDAEIVPGVRAIAAPGHTPGQVAVEVFSGEERLIYLADAVTHPIQLARPDWFGPVENWPAHTVITRHRLLRQAADTPQARVLTAHFPFPGVGRVSADGDHFDWHPDPAAAPSR